VQPTGGPTAQVCRLGPKVGGHLVLFCIHRVNWVNFRNDSVTESWWQYHKHYPGIMIMIIIIINTVITKGTCQSAHLLALPSEFLLRNAMQSAVMSQYVRLSMSFWYHDHIGWNTSKIILRLISLRYLLRLTPTWAIWSKGNTPKLGWNWGGAHERKNLQNLWNGAN